MTRFELVTSSLPRKRSTPELHRLFDAANLNLFYRFSTLRIIKILVSFNQINCLTQKNIYAPNCQSIFNQQSSHYISIPNFYSLNLITKTDSSLALLVLRCQNKSNSCICTLRVLNQKNKT